MRILVLTFFLAFFASCFNSKSIGEKQSIESKQRKIITSSAYDSLMLLVRNNLKVLEINDVTNISNNKQKFIEVSKSNRDCYENIIDVLSTEISIFEQDKKVSFFIEEWTFDKIWFFLDRKENIFCFESIFKNPHYKTELVINNEKVYVIRSQLLSRDRLDKIYNLIFDFVHR